jgi:16S rRNA (cytidine1402-2'-O)-methyltransferase
MREKSGKSTCGKLYLVSTPIGNLEDITLRALKILKEVDFIACESIKEARKILNYYNIKKPLIKYSFSKEKEALEKVFSLIKKGKSIALISDRGTPAISDPGFLLVKQCVDEGVEVKAVPGPSALVTALSISSLPPLPFLFLGFLSRKKGERKKSLKNMREFSGTIVFYESPRRLLPLLKDIKEVMGERRVVIARELTKMHEEVLRGKVSKLISLLSQRELIKGECVVLVEGSSLEKEVDRGSLEREAKEILSKGNSPSKTVKILREKYPSFSRRALYSFVHDLIESGD